MANKDKYIQDTGEKYFIYRFANVARMYKQKASLLEESFVEYANDRGVYEDFMSSDYKEAYDAAIPPYIADLQTLYGKDISFQIFDVEREYRDLGKKGDFVVKVFRDNKQIAEHSTSLKCYKDGTTLQFSSGTYSSFACSLLFEQVKTGQYTDSTGRRKFRSSGRSSKKRDDAIVSEGYNKTVLDTMRGLDGLQEKVTEFINQPICANYFDIVYNGMSNKYATPENIRKEEYSAGWKEFCKDVAYEGIDLFTKLLNNIESKTVVEKFKKVIGIGDEELLIITGDGRYVNSLTDKKLQYLKKIFTEGDISKFSVEANPHGQSINFGLSYNGKTVIATNVPLTVNKNGAWELDNLDGRYSSTDKQFNAYGARRPVKSKQMATSTNCYIKLTDICDEVREIF